ncbi:MAG: response regulator [Bacteroidetes bacterium]|nr:response regulator [Bacteroidota bacterium]
MTQSIEPKSIVLYADDDAEDRELVAEAFKPYAHHVEVVTFPNGITLLSHLRNVPPLDPSPCLIIIDINMPLLNGRETLEQLRQMDRYDSVPVVLFTTSSMPQDKNFALRHKAGFITKPIDIGQLEQITDQFISHCTEEIQKKIRRKMM